MLTIFGLVAYTMVVHRPSKPVGESKYPTYREDVPKLQRAVGLKYDAVLYEARIGAGLCAKCGGPGRPGKSICDPCAKRQSETAKARRKLKREQKANDRALRVSGRGTPKGGGPGEAAGGGPVASGGFQNDPR